MKNNAPKRKIFDAVDLLTEDTSAQVPAGKRKDGVTMLSIDSIKPFHDHPFHLYEGDRLEDMIQSIRDHGVLNPVSSVQQKMDMKCFPVITDRMQRDWPVLQRYRRL